MSSVSLSEDLARQLAGHFGQSFSRGDAPGQRHGSALSIHPARPTDGVVLAARTVEVDRQPGP